MLVAYLLGLLIAEMLAGFSYADVVVANDGSGNYTTVMDAVNGAPERSNVRYVIYVKRGMYNEYVNISINKWNLTIVGDGMEHTIITGNRSNGTGWVTFESATFVVSGDGFIARDISFRNTAGPQMHQAVALRNSASYSILFRCGVHGYQDTLYAHQGIQFYRECVISGTVDFIFGAARAVFQKCNILARKPLPGQKNTLTANGRWTPDNSGFSIQYSNISADRDLEASPGTTSTYLGRPWKKFSQTIVMLSYISDAVAPQGWLEMESDKFLDTLFYAEYKNFGPGATLGKRVTWPGYHMLNASVQVEMFTVSRFLEGDNWLPATGVPYIGGLAN